MGRPGEMPLECRAVWNCKAQQKEDEDRRKRGSREIFLIAREIPRCRGEARAGSHGAAGCADWNMRALIYPTSGAADEYAREQKER